MEVHEGVVVTSTAPPTVTWWCPSCQANRIFGSRDAFRMNAHGKTIDIWLLYGCRSCDHTKKMSVVERVRDPQGPPSTALRGRD